MRHCEHKFNLADTKPWAYFYHCQRPGCEKESIVLRHSANAAEYQSRRLDYELALANQAAVPERIGVNDTSGLLAHSRHTWRWQERRRLAANMALLAAGVGLLLIGGWFWLPGVALCLAGGWRIGGG